MKIRIGVIVLLLSIICFSSKAQVEKQVEVTKSYIPQIEPTQKLKLEPDMSDTLRLRPEIDYTITPRSINTSLSTRPYEAARATFWEFNRPERWYLKGAIGAPLSSVVDLYVSNSNPNTNYAIAYINHKGEYANIKNYYGQSRPATNTQNRIGAAAGVYIGEKILHAQAQYDIDYWSRYATNAPRVENPLYQMVSISGGYGDQFVKFNRWNFQLMANANRFFSSEGDCSTSVGGGVKLGGDIKGGRLITNVEYTYIDGNYNYASHSAMLSPTYSFTRGKFNIDLGADYRLDLISSQGATNNNHILTPQIRAQYVARPKIQPYLHLTGEVESNDYASLTHTNPYIIEGGALSSNTTRYVVKGGASGVLCGSKLRYDLFVDYTMSINARYWALMVTEIDSGKFDNYYTVEAGCVSGLSINADCQYLPIESLSLRFKASATDWKADENAEFEVGLPVAKIHLGAEHTMRMIKYGISADFESSRQTTLITETAQELKYESVKTPAAVNIKAFVEMRLKNKMSIFVEGENLANAEIYSWMGYREYGIGAKAGIKMQF